MEEDDDIVMTETPASTVMPIGAGRPSSSGPAKAPSPLKLNGAAAHALAPSLLEPFSKNGSAQGTLGGEAEKAEDHDEEPDRDIDSLMEENSDWSHDDLEETYGLPISSLPTGLCYDIRMRYHCEVKPTLDVHPEDPRRIYYIYKELCKAGLVDDPEATRPLVSQPLQRIDAREATKQEISLVHAPEHYAFVQSTKGKSDPTCDSRRQVSVDISLS
jgi:histone deacetylase 6